MSYKFLVLDIDGTATNSQKEITPKTKAAIMKLQEKGIPVALASGRPTPGLAPIADAFEFSRFGSYTLSYNGAKIINWQTKECIYQKTIPMDLPKSLYEDACFYDVGIMTYSPDEKTLFCGRRKDQYIELEERICGFDVYMCNGDFPNQIQFPVTKCLFTGEPKDLERIEPDIAKKYQHIADVYRSDPYYLEVVPKNVNKATCLSRLLPILGIKREEMVCCGDGYNDVNMIAYAGLGVAMANAAEPVKKAADYITLSCDEDGVAHVIEKFFF